MKLFGYFIISEREQTERDASSEKFGRYCGYRDALVDTGFRNYAESQPDPEIQCVFASPVGGAFISQSASFHPSFNVANLHWREVK